MRNVSLLLALILSFGIQRGESQWIQTNGPHNGRIGCLASIDTTLFAGTDGGVFVSTDRGESWAHPVSELWARELGRLAVLGTHLFAAPAYGAWLSRSSDFGNSWIPANAGLPSVDITDLAVLNSWIFVGTRGSGVYRSSDFGNTWTPAGAGPSADTVSSLVTSDSALFVGTRTGEVFRSNDDGASWLPLAPLWSGTPVTALAKKGSFLFAGTDSGRVYRSGDSGTSWVTIPTGSIVDYVTCFGFLDTNVFAGTTNGLYRSSLNGTSWAAVHNDSMYHEVNDLHTLGGDLFAATIGGVYRSTDAGESWTDENSGMRNASVRALAMEGATLFAATWGGGVFRSGDRGDSWECFLKENAIFSLAFTDVHFYAGSWGMLYDLSRTSDVTWTLSYPDTTNRVWSLGVSGDTVYAGTESGGLYRTQRIGTDWHCVRLAFKDTAVNCLILNGPALYAGTGAGVYRSTDAGEYWSPLNNGLTNQDVRALALKSVDLFAGTAGGGVFRSLDSGASWIGVNNGLKNRDILSFAVMGNNLFAGTWEGGVYLTEDNGANWIEVSHISPVDSNFRVPGVVHALAVDGTYLFAGERRTGLWRRPLSQMVTSIEALPGNSPREFRLLQNYPNPFNPLTNIQFTTVNRQLTIVRVYDVLGNQVTTLVNEVKEPGTFTVQFDGSKLASGLYFYRLTAGDYVATRKCLLLK